jgi:hypothetical protein
MGADVHQLDLGVEDLPINVAGLELSQVDLFASAIAILFVVALLVVFDRTCMGIALRGVADDTMAAQSVSIRRPVIWRIVWSVFGIVALVAGLLWGARQGVQFSLTMVVLKAMPVLIIGDFSSVSGARCSKHSQAGAHRRRTTARGTLLECALHITRCHTVYTANNYPTCLKLRRVASESLGFAPHATSRQEPPNVRSVNEPYRHRQPRSVVDASSQAAPRRLRRLTQSCCVARHGTSIRAPRPSWRQAS